VGFGPGVLYHIGQKEKIFPHFSEREMPHLCYHTRASNGIVLTYTVKKFYYESKRKG
jgi:hypothetical protein